MSDPFVGEIRMFGGNFAPVGWAFCEGQLLAISENDALFSLIGTTYGGDGRTTFALPDLRGRMPVHVGDWAAAPGMAQGVESVTLTPANAPAHTHTYQAMSASANNRGGQNQDLAKLPTGQAYRDPIRAVQMVAPAVNRGGQAHENRMPYLCVSFIISLFGIFPSQS